jgi:hypothetical protein
MNEILTVRKKENFDSFKTKTKSNLIKVVSSKNMEQQFIFMDGPK